MLSPLFVPFCTLALFAADFVLDPIAVTDDGAIRDKINLASEDGTLDAHYVKVSKDKQLVFALRFVPPAKPSKKDVRADLFAHFLWQLYRLPKEHEDAHIAEVTRLFYKHDKLIAAGKKRFLAAAVNSDLEMELPVVPAVGSP